MPRWRMTLNGGPWDLKTLVGLGVGVSEEGSGVVLRCASLDSLTEPDAVRQRAIELVQVLNGIGKLAADEFASVAIGSVSDDDSGQTVMDLRGKVTLGIRARAELTGGEPGQPTVSALRLAAAVRDQNAWWALRLFAAPAIPVNLSRVYEVICDDVGGERQIVINGWATRNGIKRFRRTVNSRSVLGAEARHGVETTTPPADPMSVPEMQAFVTGLLEKWLGAK